jgi:hypothetical protein
MIGEATATTSPKNLTDSSKPLFAELFAHEHDKKLAREGPPRISFLMLR